MTTRRHSSQLFLGAMILLVGILALLSALGVSAVSGLWRWVPALFVIMFGVSQLVASNFRHWVGPVILFAIGVALLLAAFGVLSWGLIGGAIWPVILVILGLRILFRPSGLGRRWGGMAHEAGTAGAFAAFSGSKRRVTTQDYQGGDITVLFGGAELDLREAGLETRPANVNVMVMFGGADIFVPPDWAVDVDVLALFGGSEDKRREARSAAEGEEFDLVITGMVLFGGLTVKD